MRYAIISDIHSNIEALNVALAYIKKIGCDEIICLGDIIGYGPDPEECIEIVFNTCHHIVLGNHEEVLIQMQKLKNFNRYAQEAIIWTKEHISEKSISLFKKLNYEHESEDILFVHSTPVKPEAWNYIINYFTALDYLTLFKQKICFVGHSHITGIYTERTLKNISKDTKSIINVGSIGQPRDRNPNLSIGIFDSKKWEYDNIRLPYKINSTYNKIINSGLPRFLAERLLIGV